MGEGISLGRHMDIAAETTGAASGTAYPRRRAVRFALRMLSGMAFSMVSRLRIEGRENLPEKGPFILVANHFHFADPVAILWLSRRQVEFIGGFRFVFAPRAVHFLPHLWGYFPAYRGGYSRQTLRSAIAVLEQDGVVALFPEGGIWAQVLRPPRPGAAFIALESGVPVVPIGLDGFTGLFKSWRPTLTIRVGKPLGPFRRTGPGSSRKSETEQVGGEIMEAIAGLIPAERHGVYSSDPALRQAALAMSAFPFERDELRGL
jgi:1-acyl-sn-glycerol-3-phosphate acyltransferase